MARKKTASPKTAARKTAPKPAAKKQIAGDTGDTGAAVTEAALAIAADSGWRAVTPDAVAARSGLSLGDVLLYAPTRAHLLGRFLDRLDASTLAGGDASDADSARDRLFEVLMRRFDVLNRHRESVRAVIKGAARDPACVAMVALRARRSAAALLGAAGISAEGLKGFLRVQGLGAVMAYALRAWMTDDSADMAKTMAAVDRGLAQAERAATLSPLRRRTAGH